MDNDVTKGNELMKSATVFELISEIEICLEKAKKNPAGFNIRMPPNK
jgi:ribosomal protein L5